jgi:hypothetical protein
MSACNLCGVKELAIQLAGGVKSPLRVPAEAEA